MSFGRNLQFLRSISGGMTQEALAEKTGVSRQTVSKWETDAAYPEVEKIVALCEIFSCTMDRLVREDMCLVSEAYTNLREETVAAFRSVRYAVISPEPEEDAIAHVRRWAEQLHVAEPKVIGWDFPSVSQEQLNVHHMHGYGAALVLPEGVSAEALGVGTVFQREQRYMAVTICAMDAGPFEVIPNAYKLLLSAIQANGLRCCHDKGILECFEYEYIRDGVQCMDVFIAI